MVTNMTHVLNNVSQNCVYTMKYIVYLAQHYFYYFFYLTQQPNAARAASFMTFLDHTQRHTTVGKTPLDEGSARCRDLYMTTHNTHNRQTCMPSTGFEPAIPANERPQTFALDRSATGIGIILLYIYINIIIITIIVDGL